MKTRILMITHSRPAYTELSLARLCETLPDDARLTIWDNASSDAVLKLLNAYESHPRIERIVYNRTNDMLRGPTNWFWQSLGEAEFVSKVDDDGLMPYGWIETLERAHRDIPKAGILGTWRFPEEDFVEELANQKIHTFGSHRILRNCWVEGSGYLMKREVIDRLGPIRDRESFSSYCIRAESVGFVNGWYYPFLRQEHMDDPRAPHTGIKTDEDFQKLRPLSAKTFKVVSREEWTNRLRRLAKTLQTCSYDSRDYISRRAMIMRKIHRLLGRDYCPPLRLTSDNKRHG